MNKEKSGSLQSYSKEEVKAAIKEKVDFLESVGFKCDMVEENVFMCRLDKKVVIVKNYWIYVYPNVRDIINLYLMDCDLEKLKRVLVAFEFVPSYNKTISFDIKEMTIDQYDKAMQKFAELYAKRFNNGIDADERTIAEIKKHLIEKDVEHGHSIFRHPFDSDEVKEYKRKALSEDEFIRQINQQPVYNVHTDTEALLEAIKNAPKINYPIIDPSEYRATIGIPLEEGITEVVDIPADQDVFIVDIKSSTLCSKCNVNRWIHTYNGGNLCTTCFTETVEKTL